MSHQKDQIILTSGRGILADFWVPHEIESWDFQHVLNLKPLKILAHLDNFYFRCFKGEDQRENSKSLPRLSIGFFKTFPFGPPPCNYENKSCLNELKFWEASENLKSSICWKCQLSISSCRTKKSAKIPLPVDKNIWKCKIVLNSLQLTLSLTIPECDLQSYPRSSVCLHTSLYTHRSIGALILQIHLLNSGLE